MAFTFDENKNNENERDVTDMDKLLQESKKDLEIKQSRPHSILKKKTHEPKKRYNFTLKPSNHAKLKQLCDEYGYTSASELLDSLIEEL